MGWDRPLSGFFMVIDYTDGKCAKDEGDEGLLYDNLEDEKLQEFMGVPPELDYFVAKLAELKIEIPNAMVEQILHDCEVNMGNRRVWYKATGQIMRDTNA
jgi:hypothetical protein